MIADRERYSVLIVCSKEKSAQSLTSMLPVQVFSPIVTAGGADEARRMLSQNSYDIIIIDTPLRDEFGTQFAIDISKDARGSILLLVKAEVYEAVTYKVESHGVYTLAKPSPKQIFYQTVRLMAANSAKLKSLWNKTLSLQEKMEELRMVNRAKWILIEHLHMDEDAAHKYLEREAMNSRSTKRAVAESIIRSYGC